MKSMTGYGKAEYADDDLTLTVEIKTVNNRFLDLSSKYPRGFMEFEDAIRRTVQSYVKRGKADVFISYKRSKSELSSIEADIPLAMAYYNASLQIAKELNLPKKEYSVSSLMKAPGVISEVQDQIDSEKVLPILIQTLEKALENHSQMRSFEGNKLKLDLLSRMQNIENTVKAITERAPLVQQDYRQRLNERISQVLQSVEYDESRLLQEVAIFADKSNIDEELTRLNSHIAQFRKICESDGEIGKKLDFLVQEFNREANTVCSKSNDIEITDNALSLKCEIEKVREQIQNVE